MVEDLFICPDGIPGRVDKILAHAFPDKSRSLIQKAIEEKKVRRKDGSILVAKTKICPGDELWIDLKRELVAPLISKDIPIDILFEDDEILVINKASGMVVHPGDGTKDDTLVHALLHHYPGGLCPVGAPERPGIVHRLDKETSGVMVVAKTEGAYYSLVDQFSQRKTKKEYFALVFGLPPSLTGRVDQPIGRHPKNRTKMAVVDHGKHALTEWETITQYKESFSFLRVKIHTGRTHQIRVHLSFLGHPLAGDVTYGAKKHSAFNRVMLHAHCLKFTHPVTNQELNFKAELPADFQTCLDLLSNN
jgi:23S rRNA pseudouridine1911/1915/1917 synthase